MVKDFPSIIFIRLTLKYTSFFNNYAIINTNLQSKISLMFKRRGKSYVKTVKNHRLSELFTPKQKETF